MFQMRSAYSNCLFTIFFPLFLSLFFFLSFSLFFILWFEYRIGFVRLFWLVDYVFIRPHKAWVDGAGNKSTTPTLIDTNPWTIKKERKKERKPERDGKSQWSLSPWVPHSTAGAWSIDDGEIAPQRPHQLLGRKYTNNQGWVFNWVGAFSSGGNGAVPESGSRKRFPKKKRFQSGFPVRFP